MTSPALAIPGPVDAVAAVKELNLDYLDAVRMNDVEWFRTHLAEDVVIITGAGRRLRKGGFLTVLRDEPKNYLALRVRDATFRVFGHVVQVDADAPWEMDDGTTGLSRYIDSWAWLDGRWQVISAQVTLLPGRP
ncbi:MAG TPA: nuclear transport factor 2 family protein [Gemmatimonadales bacterium]